MVANPMTDKFSSRYDRNREKDIPNDPSSLLEELAQIRKDLEQDSMALRSKNTPPEPACEENIGNGLIFESALKPDDTTEQNFKQQNHPTFNKPTQPSHFRSFYRFDLEHIEHDQWSDLEEKKRSTDSLPPSLDPLNRESFLNNESAEIDFSFKNSSKNPQKDSSRNTIHSAHASAFTQADETVSQQSVTNEKPKPGEERDNRRHDDAPVVIPINRGDNVRTLPRGFPRPERSQNVENNERRFIRSEKESTYPSLPWQAISRYENETLCRFATNASTFSLFLGWGAIACGILIFIRSFFVGSMIWLNYGLPVLSLGAVCLFLGIILSILSEKMQQINELKQNLTVQRIVSKSDRKFDPPHQNYAPDRERTVKSESAKKTATIVTQTASPPASDSEDEELKDVYERLVKLRSEIDELINECENSNVCM